MANRIVPKHSQTTAAIPLDTDLVQFEIALNSSDKTIYFKDHNNVVHQIEAIAIVTVEEW